MDIVNQSIASMALMPPHCPMNPKQYSSFYNDTSKLPGGVAPYKLETEKHARDGLPVQRLEYNNFYSDWKQDALKWYPRGTKEFADKDINNQNGHIPLPRDKALELYEATRRRVSFAVPLPTNGTNQVGILFNDKCNLPTFQYKLYASKPVNSSERFNNKLYQEDISEETEQQKTQYMDSIIQNNMNIYSSVFEDMYILQLNPFITDNLDYIRKTY
jgi:hypothetical protein